MHYKTKQALSLIEMAFIFFMLFAVYTLIVLPITSNIKLQSYKENAKQVYSLINANFKTVIKDGGYYNKFSNEEEFLRLFAGDTIEKTCRKTAKQDCWSSNWLWSTDSKTGVQFLNNKYMVADILSLRCNSSINFPYTCGILYVDINGSSSPNKVGYDILKFYITATGVFPAGVKRDIINSEDTCNLKDKFSWACTAKYVGKK